MFRLIFWSLKIALISFAAIVTSHLVRYDGITLSDRIKSQLSQMSELHSTASKYYESIDEAME